MSHNQDKTCQVCVGWFKQPDDSCVCGRRGVRMQASEHLAARTCPHYLTSFMQQQMATGRPGAFVPPIPRCVDCTRAQRTPFTRMATLPLPDGNAALSITADVLIGCPYLAARAPAFVNLLSNPVTECHGFEALT